MHDTDDLQLFVMPGCGWCQDVRDAADGLGVKLEERDVRADPEAFAALREARGRTTVPVLRIARQESVEWMGESRDIVAYLHRRFGTGKPPVRLGPYLQLAMWGLLLGGAVAGEPLRSALWTGACVVAGGRSLHVGWRTGAVTHWAIGATFLFGAVSIALSALEIADLPWWWAAFAVAAVLLVRALRARAR
ncbi:MAG: hypothetical protein SangKO_101270 [Sandaracinaceae bacterium]|nr:MAG: glutaredoxin [Sandaracinaceae bacterium]